MFSIGAAPEATKGLGTSSSSTMTGRCGGGDERYTPWKALRIFVGLEFGSSQSEFLAPMLN